MAGCVAWGQANLEIARFCQADAAIGRAAPPLKEERKQAVRVPLRQPVALRVPVAISRSTAQGPFLQTPGDSLPRVAAASSVA